MLLFAKFSLQNDQFFTKMLCFRAFSYKYDIFPFRFFAIKRLPLYTRSKICRVIK